MARAEAVAVGAAYLDFNALHFPAERIAIGKEIVGGEYVAQPGGSPLNFVRTANSMGLEAVFIGKLGKDFLADAVELRAAEQNLPAYFIKGEGLQTNIAVNFQPELGDPAMTVFGTANASLTGDELGREMERYTQDARYLYIGSCFKMTSLLSSFIDIATEAKNKGIKIILDHGRIDEERVDEETREAVRNIIPMVDVYVPSKDEFLTLWETESVEEGLMALSKTAPDTLVIVKDGANGVTTLSGGEIVTIPAFNVEAQRIVGAGDAFNAGFLVALRDGKNMEEAMRYGCATAAVKISEPGSPTREKVDSFIASQ